MDVVVIGACPFPAPQGSQTFLAQSARALARRGHRVRVLAYGYGTGTAAEPGIEVVRSARLPGARRIAAGPSPAKPIHDVLLALRLRRLLRETPAPDVLLAHNHEAAVVAALVPRPRGTALAYYAHTAMAEELPSFLPGWGRLAARLGRWADDWIPRRVDRTLTVCAELAQVLRDGGAPRGSVCAVLPGVDADEWRDLAPDPARYRRPEAVYTGTLDAFQNVDGLLEALRLASREVPDAKLVVASAGDGGPLRARAARAGVADRVELVPATPFAAVQRRLASAPVAVLARVQPYGFPIKLLNYMAAGAAVVAAAPSAKILRHLDTGWVADPPSPSRLAAGLVALWRDPELARRLGAAARREALADHDLGRFGAAVERELVASRRTL